MRKTYFNLYTCLFIGLGLHYFLTSLLLLSLLLLLYSFLQINNDIVGVGILLNLTAGWCVYTFISILLQIG
jgi:hypothetical protein